MQLYFRGKTVAVFKRGKFYWFEFWFKGERVQKSTKVTNRRDAEGIESAYWTKLAKGELDLVERKKPPKLSPLMKDFLNWSKFQHKSHPRTTIRYETSSKPLRQYFKDKRIDRISPDDIEQYKIWRSLHINAKTKGTIKPATINRELACLKAAFNYAIKADLLLKNPVSRVKFYNEENEQMRILSYEEESLYLSHCSQPLKDVAMLMLETGMRPEEVYRIKPENINLHEEYLYNPFGKTKAARRKVPLNKKALEVIRKRISKGVGQYLFSSPRCVDKPIVKLNHAHYGALRRSKISHFRLYDLRHTWATRAAMSGIDLVTLAALLGHSKINMVMRYAHPTEAHQRQAMKKLQDFNAARQMEEMELREVPTKVPTLIN
ncbi:MAG: tyrosine-type recombinase/integrase [Blastocatellia bacterium]